MKNKIKVFLLLTATAFSLATLSSCSFSVEKGTAETQQTIKEEGVELIKDADQKLEGYEWKFKIIKMYSTYGGGQHNLWELVGGQFDYGLSSNSVRCTSLKQYSNYFTADLIYAYSITENGKTTMQYVLKQYTFSNGSFDYII